MHRRVQQSRCALTPWDSLHISGAAKARNSKIGTRVDPMGGNKKKEKIGQWGS